MAKELKKVNVVTVGVGFTGGIALAECAKAGLSVVGLERGDRRGVEDFQDIHDEWRYAVNYGLMQDLSKETITFRNTEEMRALPMRKLGSFLLGDGLGGAGVHWNGMNFRFSPYDFQIKTMTDERDAEGNLLPDADRLTNVGRFVRSTSIDELPQLINVVKGDMALIGPRPLLSQYLPLYSEEQARRHEVRPGITGWAQCHGRNAISWTEKFKLDVWYVDHCSFLTDLKVIGITIKKVLVRDGISQEGNATMEAFNGHN